MKTRIRMLGILAALVLIFPYCNKEQALAQRIRPPARAGQIYPADPGELSRAIQSYLQKAELSDIQIDGQVTGVWVPHAGYVFSGPIAASAFRFVRDLKPDAVLVIAPSHTTPLKGASIGDWDEFRTPLGNVPVQTVLAKTLADANPLIQISQPPHVMEHAVEVQLPFIQTLLPDVPLIPVVVGQIRYADCERIADAIVRAAKGKKILLVASSDMSHYPAYEDAKSADGRILKAVAELDPRKVWDVEESVVHSGISNLDCGLCGKEALVTVMLAARQLGVDGVQVLPYRNSGDVSGDHDRVVGYGAAVFYQKGGPMVPKTEIEDIPFSKTEVKKLFQIARKSILAALNREALPDFAVTEDHLKVKRGVFVTLTNGGQLRGCIGHFGGDYPLHEIVANMAVAAATQDYRFAYDPVTSKEMDRIDIKISILSDLKKIQSIDEIEIGKHGIWVKQGGRGGTYLPEVATELGWNREEFLSSCCAEKAGLPADAWKKGAEIYIYTSQILDEKDYR